uniref:G_PROTEIN_RECEP_F1_2 domain-containing protein n=1 Tax=Steinernema glaseri TaxID=37863 RepID=A0A1I8AL23_9BILA
MLRYCTPNGSLSLDPDGADGGLQGEEQFAKNIGLVYIAIGFVTIPICCFVLSVFCRRPLIKHSCYKLMAFTTALDVVNLANGTLLPGFLSNQNVHHCNSGIVVSYLTQYVFSFWMMYCCASEILALNRMLEFANKNLANLLFEGRWVYFWFVVSFAYAV